MSARSWGGLGSRRPRMSPDGSLVEIVELLEHPWFLAVQFHPEFKSKPTKAHPLFRGFIQACLLRKKKDRKPEGERVRPVTAAVSM